MGRRRYVKLGLGVALSLLFIFLIVRNTDGATFVAALSSARYGWIIFGVALFLIGYACRIQRWRLMLNADGNEIALSTAVVPFLTSIAANNVLPFRAGDVMRVVAFSGWLGVGKVQVLATMLVERLLDLLCLLTVFGLALLLLDGAMGAETGRMIGLGAGGVLAIAAAVLLVLVQPGIFKWTVLSTFRMAGANGGTMAKRATAFFDTLQQQAESVQMGRLIGWSVLAWAFEGSVFYAAARALPGMTEPLAGLLAFPVATLATLLPSTPGYAGTFHYFAIWAAELMGNPLAVATAFAVIVHMVLWLTATVAGGVCAAIWLSAKQKKRGQQPIPGDVAQPKETP